MKKLSEVKRFDHYGGHESEVVDGYEGYFYREDLKEWAKECIKVVGNRWICDCAINNLEYAEPPKSVTILIDFLMEMFEIPEKDGTVRQGTLKDLKKIPKKELVKFVNCARLNNYIQEKFKVKEK